MRFLKLPPAIRFLFTIVIMGVAMVISQTYAYPNMNETTHWPSTSGQIVHVELIGPVWLDLGAYKGQVSVKYVLHGQPYSAIDTIFLGTSLSQARETMTKEYIVGKKVSVSYDPRRPSSVVLVPGFPKASFSLFVVGEVFLVGGGILLILLLTLKAYGRPYCS